MTQLDLLQLLGGTLGKGLLLLLAALVAVRCLSRRSAAGRYAIWAAGFAGLVLLPVFSLVLPSLEPPRAGAAEPMPHGQPMTVAVPPSPNLLTRPMTSLRMSGRDMGPPMDTPEGLEAPRRGPWHRVAAAVAPWLLAVWLVGALAAMARLIGDVRRVRGLARRAAVLRRGPLYDLAADVAAELGVWQPVRIALSRELVVPIVSGFRRPIVILPAPARRWDPERRRVVLRHELAHIRRGDYASHLLIELGCAMHWPNPLAWVAARRARLEQEQACDDRVLALGTEPVEYAEHLLAIARAFARPMPHARGALAMAAAATLPDRMRAILDVRLDHGPAGRRTVLAVAGAALVLGMPTAALRPWESGLREGELVARLSAPDPLVRRDALWSLGARGAGGAEAAVVARLADLDPATRGVAAWALGKLGGRSAVDPLLAALRDRDAQVREMAVLALGELRDPRAVPALSALAADPEHGVRSVMTVALQQIGGEPAAEALARLARSDGDQHTRVMAVGALGKFRSGARVPALEGALGDPEPAVRRNAAAALERIGGAASVPALLAALECETDAEASDAMIRALGASKDVRATDGLIRALADTAPELRESAAHMLGELGDERAVDPLIAATRDPDHEVRLTAVWALDALERAR